MVSVPAHRLRVAPQTHPNSFRGAPPTTRGIAPARPATRAAVSSEHTSAQSECLSPAAIAMTAQMFYSDAKYNCINCLEEGVDLQDPVIAEDGRVYCRQCIQGWINECSGRGHGKTVSLLTNLKMGHRLVPLPSRQQNLLNLRAQSFLGNLSPELADTVQVSIPDEYIYIYIYV